jgi:hypothetical protein
MKRAVVLLVAAAAAVAACVERMTAPGRCPDFCPDSLRVVDTVLRTVVGRDTAFRGYWRPHEVVRLLVASLPGIESRALSRTDRIATTYQFGTDTTKNPIVGVDSVRLDLVIVHRDTAAHNLRLHLYHVPKTFDSTTTFADVGPSFAGAPVRAINVDSLITLPGKRDPATGDSVTVDTTTKEIRLRLMLDSAQAPYVPADSGRLAFGFRATADSPASIALGSRLLSTGMLVTWFVKVDSLGLDTVPRSPPPVAGTAFDTFVFDPPPQALDSTLAVGGMPVARSILRVNLPPAVRDSAQIVRATLVLVPAQAAAGAPADSFFLAARRVVSDLGAKSPLASPQFIGDSSHVAFALIHIGSTDTVRIEVTSMVALWAADTTLASTFMLQRITDPRSLFLSEGTSLAEIRFRPSSDPAFRPALHVTYIPRFRFEVP